MKYKELLNSHIGLQIQLSHQNGMCYVLDINNRLTFTTSSAANLERFIISEVGEDYLVLSSPKGRICIPLDKVVFYTIPPKA